MKKTVLKKGLFFLMAATGGLLILHSLVLAQGAFPTRPVTIWIGFAPGGTTDIIIRPLAEGSEKSLGQKIVVMNKPGGGGAVCASLIAKEKPDGYTLAAFPDTPILRSPHLTDLDYDAFRDFTHIIRVGAWKNVFVVRSDSPFKEWKDVVNWAKKNPGQLTFGNAGAGTATHLAMVMIAKKDGFTFRNVPFAGAAPLLSALLGGHVMVGATGPMTIHSHVLAKTLKVLLVNEREGLDYAPDAPTLEKMNYGFEVPNTVIICGPKGMPDQVREILQKSFIAGMKHEAFKKVAEEQEMLYADPLTGEALLNYLKKWYGLYEVFIKEAGIYKSERKK